MGSPVSEARTRLLSGDVAGASAALATLDPPARLLATLALSREASARGIGPDVQEPLLAELDGLVPIDRKAPAPASAFDDLVFRTWHASAGAIPIARIVAVLRLALHEGAALAPEAVRAELARGRFDEARALAALIPKAKKAAYAEAQARLAVHGAEKQREKTLAKLAEGALGKTIADGGEESDALGAILDVMAGAGLPASEPTVETIRAGLLRLTDEPSRRQQTDWGVLRALRACAARKDDPAWRALGEQLEKYGLQHPISRREGRRIWAEASGEPLPPPLTPAALAAPSSYPTATTIAPQAVAKLLAGDAEGATEIIRSNPSEASMSAREAARLLLESGHELEAVAWAAPLDGVGGAFEVVAKGLRDPDRLEALEAALPALLPHPRQRAVSQLARAAARLGVMDAWRERLVSRVDAATDARSRDYGFSVLVAAAPPSVAVELVERWLASRAPRA